MYAASIVESAGVRVTTISEADSVGTGYLYNGVILQSCGNGFYSSSSPFRIVGYLNDKGAGYRRAVRSLGRFGPVICELKSQMTPLS